MDSEPFLEELQNVVDVPFEEHPSVGVVPRHELRPVDDEDVVVRLQNHVVLAKVSVDDARRLVSHLHVLQDFVQNLSGFRELSDSVKVCSLNHAHDDDVAVVADGPGNRNSARKNEPQGFEFFFCSQPRLEKPRDVTSVRDVASDSSGLTEARPT